MEKGLGQTIVVEAKPGLAGALAAETVARSDADGYTLLVVPSAHPAHGALAKNVKYNVVDDFTWISVASFYPFMICVRKDSRFTSFKQLIDEINHRVKNTLATVQSFASQSLRNARSLAEGRAAFEARLIALSKSHDVLTREQWEGADSLEWTHLPTPAPYHTFETAPVIK